MEGLDQVTRRLGGEAIAANIHHLQKIQRAQALGERAGEVGSHTQVAQVEGRVAEAKALPCSVALVLCFRDVLHGIDRSVGSGRI